MSVRALCDAACRLGMDAATARTLALYEGVLAADPAAQPVLAWAQAVADELQARTDAATVAAAAVSSSDGGGGGGGACDDGLWPHDDESAAIARMVAQAAELDRRRQVVEALTERGAAPVANDNGDDNDNDNGVLTSAATEFVAACEVLQQVLRDVAAEDNAAAAAETSANPLDNDSSALAQYLEAERAALDTARDELQRACDTGTNTSTCTGSALSEVERDAWLLQRAFTAGEVALLDAHVSRAEAQAADPACACPAAPEATAEAALQRLSDATLPRVLAAAQRAETLPLLLADSARRRAVLAAQGRAVARAADALAAACARAVLLAALCESAEQHVRALAEVLERAGAAAEDAAESVAALGAECAQMAGAPGGEGDRSAVAAFVRAVAALCTGAAQRTGVVLEPAGPAEAAAVDQVAAWLACLRRSRPPAPLAPLLRRAGVALPLTETSGSNSGSGNGEGTTTTEQLEALLAMARELATQVHSLRAQVADVLAHEQHDAHYRTQRTLWECFLHEPDKLLALVQPSSSSPSSSPP